MVKIEVNGEIISYVEVRPISFAKFVETTENVVSSQEERKKVMQRKRIQAQTKAFNASGEPVDFSDFEIARLPVKAGMQIVAAVNNVLDTSGETKILQDGDGITSPIRVQLSQPIVYKDSETKSEKIITELEFMAKTFGDVEGIFTELNPTRQALDLISTVAVPITENMRMQKLPSWAVDGISVVDGSFITNEVLPRFLG